MEIIFHNAHATLELAVCIHSFTTSPTVRLQLSTKYHTENQGDRRGRARMVVGFSTTYAISGYHH